MGGGNKCGAAGTYRNTYFDPLAPCGARPNLVGISTTRRYFNPLAPCGARLTSEEKLSVTRPFQSTRPMRGETEPGRDRRDARRDFNPLAPCGARLLRGSETFILRTFQSTRPMRGETLRSILTSVLHVYFNPLAPCGARLAPDVSRTESLYISIHSPHAGRDRAAR